jgi:hypothetical protein
MRLYHLPRYASLLTLLALALVAACSTAPQATQALIQVNLTADGETLGLSLPPGSTVQDALDEAGLTLNALDRSEPPAYTVLSDGASLRVVRVSEEFEIEEVVLPFERQMLRNESLPVEQEVLIQRGKNGLQEITYRRVFEDGLEVSNQPVAVNSVIVEQPVPEISMIGVQTPFSTVEIPGTLYYLRDGNLWKIQEDTGNRQAVITTGDLDGRILSISDDQTWALVTRRAKVDGRINELWAMYIGGDTGLEATPVPEDRQQINLEVNNVIHFADWAPGSITKIYFSTVEPRPTAPGWQANNDLHSLTFSTTGWTTQWVTIIEANAGGVYGWWGVNYLFSPDGRELAFARPDSIGIVDVKTGAITTTLDILPLQPIGDWAWVPGITWGPVGKAIYTVEHIAAQGAVTPEESPDFDLSAVLTAGSSLRLVSQTGMFAYPLASPVQSTGSGLDYQIAYLQAVNPSQSDTSRYRLAVMDRDGSDRRVLFPAAESPGLSPLQHWGDWSPSPLPASGNYAIAILDQGNLWLVDTQSGAFNQVTGDGLTTRVLWR